MIWRFLVWLIVVLLINRQNVRVGIDFRVRRRDGEVDFGFVNLRCLKDIQVCLKSLGIIYIQVVVEVFGLNEIVRWSGQNEERVEGVILRNDCI